MDAGRWGAPIFGGWRDTVLGTDCEVTKAIDGVERCMPTHAEVQSLAQFWGDAACTQPLAQAPRSPCGSDKYAVNRSDRRTYALKAPHTGAVYTNVGSACTLASQASSDLSYDFHTFDWTEVPPTVFGATEHHDTQVGGFIHQQYGFGDGSSLDLGTLAFPSRVCRPLGGLRSGTTHCLPTAAPAVAAVYSDAACTSRAYYWNRAPQDMSIASEIVTEDPSLCGTEFSVYTVDTTLASGPAAFKYYEKKLGTCTERTASQNAKLFRATPTSTYPTGTVEPDASTGRLGYLMWTGPDGISIPVANWDHVLGRECYALVGKDGVFRCIPYSLRRPKHLDFEQGYFSASCDSPHTEVAGACDGLPPVDNMLGQLAARPTKQSCDAVSTNVGWEVTTIGAEFTAYYATENACEAYPEAAYGYPVQRTVIDSSTFAALSEQIE